MTALDQKSLLNDHVEQSLLIHAQALNATHGLRKPSSKPFPALPALSSQWTKTTRIAARALGKRPAEHTLLLATLRAALLDLLHASASHLLPNAAATDRRREPGR